MEKQQSDRNNIEIIKECDNRIDRIVGEFQKQFNNIKNENNDYKLKINNLRHSLNEKETNYNTLTIYLQEANENITINSLKKIE